MFLCVRTVGPNGGGASDDRITDGSELGRDGTGTNLIGDAGNWIEAGS